MPPSEALTPTTSAQTQQAQTERSDHTNDPTTTTPTTPSANFLQESLAEIKAEVQKINALAEGIDLKEQASILVALNTTLQEELKACAKSLLPSIARKSYRLLKNVHLYRQIMVQVVYKDQNGEIVSYGDVLAQGHSMDTITAGSARADSTEFSRVALPSDIEFIDVFGGHNVFYALPKEGNFLYVWGINTSGCAGFGNTENIAIPARLELSFRPKKILSGTSSTKGNQTTLILSEDGRIFGAGKNTCGELGIGNTIDSSSFVECANLQNIVDFDFASDGTKGYALAFDSAGDLWAWGFNESGNLGLGINTNVLTPTKIDFEKKVTKVSCAIGAESSTYGATSLILFEDGSVRGAGYNKEKQLSQTESANSNVFIGLMNRNGVDYLANIKEIYAPSIKGTGFLIDNNNNLYAFGYGGFGFGDDTEDNAKAADIVLEDVLALEATSSSNTRAIAKIDGALLAFGSNTDGALGIGQALDTRVFSNVFLPFACEDFKLQSFLNEAYLVVLANDSIYACGTSQNGALKYTTYTLQQQI